MYDSRDDFIADIPAMIELTPDLRTTIVAIYPDHHGAVLLIHNTGTTPDGGPIENTMIGVSLVHDGVTTRTEYFPEDALDAARARLAELAPAPGTAVPSNRAIEAMRRSIGALVRHDEVAFNAMHTPEFRNDDRRAGVRIETAGVEPTSKAVMRECTGVEFTPIATRGGLLVLFHQVVRGETSAGFAWEIETLAVAEIDDDDHLTDTVIFDADDVDAALAELDARYLADEGAPFAQVIRTNLAAVDAFNRRDFDAMRMLYAETIDVVDHRVAQFPTYTDRADFLRDVATMVELTPDLRMIIAAIYPDQHGTVALVRGTATTADGGEIEGMVIGVSVVRDGVVTRFETFTEDALDAARARLAELAPHSRTA
jgi:ketosteroid isomerase-like protein